MKANRNLIATLSLRSIEAKARKAAAVAAVEAKKQSAAKICKHPRRPIPAIDRDINAVFRALSSKAPDQEAVVLERMADDQACRARISIYAKRDIMRQQEEQAAYKEGRAAGVRLEKPFRAIPSIVYAFYGSAMEPSRLGSIAIYGANATATQARILRCGTLFGYRVRRATVEVGRRPFVDVVLR